MKCDTCKFKKLYIGRGAPDDYGFEYCSKEHWIGDPTDDTPPEIDIWENCPDYRCEHCGGSGGVEIGLGCGFESHLPG